jgi:hypothetical protein
LRPRVSRAQFGEHLRQRRIERLVDEDAEDRTDDASGRPGSPERVCGGRADEQVGE